VNNTGRISRTRLPRQARQLSAPRPFPARVEEAYPDPLANRSRWTGEFRDAALEKEYRRASFFSARAHVRVLVTLLAILLVTVLAAELMFVTAASHHWIGLVLRLLYLSAAVLTVMRVCSLSDFAPLASTVTSFEVLSLIVWLYLSYLSRNAYHPLVLQTGTLSLALLVLLIPNRWLHTVILSAAASLTALLLAPWASDPATRLNLLVFMLFQTGALLAAAMLTRRSDTDHRAQYLRQEKLLRVSLTDPLTGIANRGRFNEALQDWVRCAHQYHVALSLVLFDFDDFKAVNDTYGHLIGDQVILQTVNLVDDAIRRRDIFARWGGEEFTLLFPDTRLEDAVEIVERLRQTVESHKYPRCGQVTASFGVVQYRPGESPEAFMDRADRLLYRAKADGKNCVRTAG
jgi:diguanylate cyclase (GGDEF)-like protein